MTPLIASAGAAQDINLSNNYLGMRFTVPAVTTVAELGRLKVAGNSLVH